MRVRVSSIEAVEAGAVVGGPVGVGEEVVDVGVVNGDEFVDAVGDRGAGRRHGEGRWATGLRTPAGCRRPRGVEGGERVECWSRSRWRFED